MLELGPGAKASNIFCISVPKTCLFLPEAAPWDPGSFLRQQGIQNLPSTPVGP